MSTKIEQLEPPLYRGKSYNNEYVIGFLHRREIRIKVEGSYDRIKGYEYSITEDNNDSYHTHKVEPETLSISFPDILDNKNNRIFVSLSNSGKGGDYTFTENGYNETFCWDSLNGCIVLKSPNYEARLFKDKRTTHFKRYKIIGIQE